ncbi:hypothetical protein E0Z10_g8820 [Xylaria hypoxylon]|uniref:NACHT domain-containing protein n=1 Tax=Xylaria hypoxylon TaxID=37992 RepID=A0A4Z0YAA5_9PEZI|nr:hypothetical protein E0Z10_g8820 [Xylaria hypoxylon]
MDPVSGTRAPPPGAFGKAIDEFLTELKKKHQEDSKNPFLHALISHAETPREDDASSQSEVSAQELQSSILELDARKRTGKGYRLLHRLSPFLEVLKNLLKKSEAFAEVAPFGVAIAFIGARIVLEMALAVEEYLEVVVTAMERITGILEVYQRLSSSPDLGSRLVHSYKAIITFWYKLSKVLSSSKAKGIIPRTMLTPLKKETEDALKSLQEDMHINLGISQAAGLLMADIDRQARVDADQRALKNDIRQWIMGQNGVDFKGDYETQLDMRYEDTCVWILQDRRFLDWQNSRNNALLWYNAQPGSGKSVLASVVVNYLARAEKKVAYFFYSFNKNSSRHVADGLRILALQLLAFVKTPSDKLVDLYETETQFAPYLNNLRTTASVVHELMTRNDDLYVVIDGIDECEDEKEMLHLIEWLIDQPTLGTVRWLFTSRVSEIEKTMQKLQAVEIHPSPEDIREDIKNYLSPKIRCEHCLLDWTNECDNNFLIARFIYETLGKLTSDADIKAELRTFPNKLNGYYTRTLAKIDTRGQMEQLVARRIFLILASARQTLSIDELVDALAIQRGSQDYSVSRLPKEELIRDLCGSLIIVEQHASESSRSPLIKFCHKSVKDFFQQDPKTCDLGVGESLHKYFASPSSAHEEIGLDCLTYLMYGRYSKHIDLGFLDSVIPKEHAFLRYAAIFWFQHLHDKSIEIPSPAVPVAVREFISSKGFWNCLRVQSHVAPYLFGRYTSQKKCGFKMAIRGREWKGDDRFAVPLPTWLGDHSSDDLLRDQSLCHFTEEWREVIITNPHGLDQCIPMKPFANSCWLKSLSKTNTVRAVNLAEAFGNDIITTSRLVGVGFSGKKLCVDLAYQTKDTPTNVICRLKQPLFKANSRPQRSHQTIHMDSDISNCAIYSLLEEGISRELVAWSVDPRNLDLRMVDHEYSEPIKAPSLPTDSKQTVSEETWGMLAYYNCNETKADVEKLIHVVHMSRKSRTIRSGRIDDDDQDNDDSDDSSEATADEEESHSEDEFSDDDTSSSESGDESTDEEMTTDESDLESHSGDQEDTDCLIIIPQGRSPYWTKPWRHPQLLWSRIVPAVHPTESLVAFMHTPNQLELVKGETQISRNLSGLADEPEEVLASARELRFSQCGNYLHCLTILFVQNNLYTKCCVTTSSFKFTTEEEEDATKPITASQISRVVYNFADPLTAMDPPFALTYWCDSYVIVALPPLTCNPKILKIALNSDTSDPVLTLRNLIYFPASTPRRDARLVYRPSSKDSEGYIFLVLNAVPAAENATSDTSSPVTALRWSVSDEDGWRPWSEEEDINSSDMREGSHIWSFMRGNFVESGKPFSVPVRAGLNWTRKSYLSCS